MPDRLFRLERLKFKIAAGRSQTPEPPLREDEPPMGVDEGPAGRGNRHDKSAPEDAEGEHNRM